MAACVSVPDDLRGEEIKAYVVLQDRATAGEQTLVALAAFCSERLAEFKVPRYWEFRSDLPMTASERVAKSALRSEGDLTAGAYDRIQGVWR